MKKDTDPVQDLEKLLLINEEQMDTEWANQPIRYIQVVRLCARTQAEVSLHKISIDEKEAALNLEFKREGVPGIDRPTVESIKSAVIGDPRMQAMTRDHVELEQRLELLEGLKKAFEMRERSLKYIQMLNALPISDEDRNLGSAARQAILSKYTE